ncbi:outer membrane protein [Microvirga lenta]|uniref:outer membrane protein n=1 Tax=Microvirga lenta TaxID=2881337 RepID=UPI001CFFC9C4|nr:outer membrane beta-barrel protein [Microvirga lenta]MCB5176785.1 outer membrane beta-barrel protein [Microvirga lenta]
MMKFLLLSAAALIAGTALAAADDLPVIVNPTLNWTGFYAGVHGAWIRNIGDAVRTGIVGVPATAVPNRTNLGDDGLGGGGQIGYQMQFGNVVAGIETDFTLADVGRARSSVSPASADPACQCTATTELSSEMNWFGSVRGRVGVAVPDLGTFFDRSLIYLTGGLAYAQIEHRGQITVTPPGVGLQATSDDVKTGFTVGAGTEIALTQNVSIKSETLYYNLKDENLTLARAGDQAAYRFKSDGWISRIGVNVRF